ncbi:general odorant-binding protein 57b-like isoform X3 [Drosophila bipectinata]|uniref:general odorant-binding protein 57b-like isoform X3 n=1 Tax=Drosophila bipectinata TaxID=42026 RepID=UPI001C890E15|nr:general odorant-binding protein 57b-like isoform X3 [Drosophila bipectinata]
MHINRPVGVAVLIVSLISLAQSRHPFDFFDESLEDFDECLRLNNISEEEYVNFERFENLQNVLKENVGLKFKCNIKCQLERQPKKWLNNEGKMDLQLMNATEEAAAVILKCMEGAPEESCSYAFKLVICASRADHPILNFEDIATADLAIGWDEEEVQLEDDDEDDDDVIDYESTTLSS